MPKLQVTKECLHRDGRESWGWKRTGGKRLTCKEECGKGEASERLSSYHRISQFPPFSAGVAFSPRTKLLSPPLGESEREREREQSNVDPVYLCFNCLFYHSAAAPAHFILPPSLPPSARFLPAIKPQFQANNTRESETKTRNQSKSPVGFSFRQSQSTNNITVGCGR